jgi:hypothetical protein
MLPVAARIGAAMAKATVHLRGILVGSLQVKMAIKATQTPMKRC